MSEVAEKKKRSVWPWVFLLLNVSAIALWFVMTGLIPTGEMKVAAIRPSGVEVRPDGVETIEVEFDADINPDSVRGDSLSLVPPVAGRAELSGPRTLCLRLNEPLRPATGYRIVWSPTVRGRFGQTAPGELAELATTRLAFESAEQSGFDRDSYSIALDFNQPVRAADLEDAISVQFSLPEGDSTREAKVVSSGTASRHILRVRESRASMFLVTIPAGFAGAGPLGLKEDVRLLWNIAGRDVASAAGTPEWAMGLVARELTATLTFHGMTAGWDGAAGMIRVRTTAPVETVRARDYVRIDPEVPVTFSSDWQGLRILGPFQPAKQYRVTLKAGLPAGDAGALAETVTRQVWFDNLPPQLEFAFGGGYLRPGGLLKVPVRSRNVKRFNVGLRQLYPENIVETVVREYGDESAESEYSSPQKKREIGVAGGQDVSVETLLDLRDLAGGELSGVYGLEVWQGERSWDSKSAFLVVSNLGLTTRLGRDRIFVWAVALDKAASAPGVAVRVYSNRRQCVAEGTTGEDGTLELALPSLPEGEEPVLAIAQSGDEITFVRMDRNRNQRGDAESRGDGYPEAYQAFLATDRGVYRGGETVSVSGLIRDAGMDAPDPLPFDLVLTGPDGKELRKQRERNDAAGALASSFSLPESAPGGAYRIRLRLPGDDGTVGSASFRVADYMPETLKLSLDLPEAVDAKAAYPVRFHVERLAGGEVGRLRAKVVASYQPAKFAAKGWDGWRFGDWRTGKGGGTETRTYDLHTDEQGDAAETLRHPAVATPGAVSVNLWFEVYEPGGRAVTASAEKTMHTAPFYIGLRKDSRLEAVGEKAAFSLAAVLPDGGLASPTDSWKARFTRLEYSSLLKRRNDGRLVYEWDCREVPESESDGDWKEGRAELSFLPKAGGNYRVVVESADGKAAGMDFTVSGYGDEVWTGEDPERLVLTTDRETYSVGDEAVVTVQAPFAGTALVTVERDRVVERRIIELTKGENRIPVEVGEAFRPNAYVGVTLIRPVGSEAEWKPHRVAGVAGINVDNGDCKLQTVVTAPESIRPGREAEVSVAVTRDGKPVPDAAVYLWAVDEGVLSLTDFRTPSPWDFFYRRRGLGVSDADMYSRLAPELEEWRGGKTPSAGGGSGEFERRLNPIAANRVRAAVVNLGRLTTNEDGVAAVAVTAPQFAGRMRLMAWAAEGRNMGSGDRPAEIKSPVMLQASWPRFAAPGDRFDVAVTVINRSGKDGVVRVRGGDLQGVRLEPEEIAVPIEDEKSAVVVFQAVAETLGKAEATLTARLADDEYVDRVEFAVRPPVLFARSSGIVEIPADGKAVFAPDDAFLPGTGKMKLIAAGSPQVKLAGAMESLLEYPYGCAEQTSSRLAGLVFLPELVSLSRPGQVESGETERLVAACLSRLAMMQAGGGGFRMWPDTGTQEFWVTAQVLYILEEAAAAGVEVPDAMLRSARTFVKNSLEGSMDEALEDGGEKVALACLALARGGDIRRSWLVLLQERAAASEKRLSSAALGYLCEAVALAGDREEAERLFRLHGPDGAAGGVAGNPVIDDAAWLSAAVQLGRKAAAVGLALAMDRSLDESYYGWTTRENAFALMALGKHWRQSRPNPDTRVVVRIDGKEHAFPAAGGRSWDNLPPNAGIEAEAVNGGPVYLFWMAEGVPAQGGAVAEDRGMRVRRKLFALDGTEIAAPFRLRQGEVYEAVLDIDATGDDLVLADLLPAGLEIEDAALKGQEVERAVRGSARAAQIELKDDRLLWFGSCSGEGSYRYRVRAVTPGTFVWPAVDGARMYEPTVRSVGASGQLVVEKAGDAVEDDAAGDGDESVG